MRTVPVAVPRCLTASNPGETSCAAFVFRLLLLVYLLVPQIRVTVLAQSSPVNDANRWSVLREFQGPDFATGNQLLADAQKQPMKFAKPVTYSTGEGGTPSIAIVDVNGDGYPDMVIANYCPTGDNCSSGEVGVLLGKGDGTFDPAEMYSSGGISPDFVAVSDVNGDGNADLVVVNDGSGTIGVLLGNGNGTFQAASTYSLDAGGAGALIVGDVNGDGRPDILVTVGYFENPGFVVVLLGNGDGSFQNAVGYSSGGYGAGAFVMKDLNEDGYPDLIVANACQTLNENGNCEGNAGAIGVLLGNGNGTYEPVTVYNSGGYSGVSFAVGDINRDGYPDIVVANGCQTSSDCGAVHSTGSVNILLGNGNGTFTSTAIYSSGGFEANSISIGDLNGDGIPDLAVSNLCETGICFNGPNTGEVSTFMGFGNGTFGGPGSFGSGGYEASSVVIRDVNGDGYPDLVVTNECGTIDHCENGEIAIFLGSGGGFQKALRYSAGGAESVSTSFADFAGNGRPDLVVLNYCTFRPKMGACTNYNGALSLLLNETSYTTTTTLSSSPNPAHVNQPVTFMAIVDSTPSVPNGEVITFYNGKSNLGESTTVNGIAILTTSSLSAGKYTIKASYPGDAFHKASSGTVKQVVNP